MKKLMVICAPVTSRSGYGNHARDLVRSFMDIDEYNIKILDVKWGETPRNALDKNNLEHSKIIDCIVKDPKNEITRQPDIYVDIRIPNEFETHGKFNIGITAGIETNAVSGKWLEGCNKMDLVIVPSEHSKQGFINTIYDKTQNLPDGQQQKIGELKLEKPMEVLFEGVDDDIYKPLSSDEIPSDFFDMLNEKIPEKFAFLFVGLWGNQPHGEDRKNTANVIKVFYESFANKKKKPALILKSNGAGFSIMDREDCIAKINHIKSQFPSDWDLPNVYLLHGSLSDEEMNYLYNHPKIKSMVSFTHGEGFGRPLLEATMVGLPVIASNWSGHLDFLNEENSMLIGGEINNVPKSAIWDDIIIPESKWFDIDLNQGYKVFNYSFINQEEIKNKGKKLMYVNRDKFTLEKMTNKLSDMMKEHCKDIPQQVNIKLPKLKKSKPKLEETTA